MYYNAVFISDWTKRSELLLEKVGDVLNKVGCQEVSLPTTVYDEEKPISIVFAGQYSAGKSTIIKALTGIEDIEIGEGIKTIETHFYDWNNIQVVDTPGIHTTLRPDHDEISYKAIANADMLVYVVTQELFDDFLGDNFRKLLLDKDKATEMILVVNKMADVGNTEKNQNIKLKDLERVTTPYSPTDLRTVFIDAESYIDSLSEDDDEIASELNKRSNYEQLVNTINAFVHDKGYVSKITTVLYKLYEILQDTIPAFQSSTGDNDVDMTEEYLLRERHIILQTTWQIESSVKAIYESAASEIRDRGRLAANELLDCSDEVEASSMLEKAYDDVKDISMRCEREIIEKIEALTRDYQGELDEFYNSEFVSSLRVNLSKRKDKDNAVIKGILERDTISKGGEMLVQTTVGKEPLKNGLKALSGSKAHEWVLNIGHFFGHDFKPWEALKLVKGLKIAGKVLGITGVVLSLGAQIKEDIDADQRRNEMRENREIIRGGFNEVAEKLIIHYNKLLENYINENYRKRIDVIDNNVQEIRALRKDKTEACELLETTQDECRQLISDIHRTGELLYENSPV